MLNNSVVSFCDNIFVADSIWEYLRSFYNTVVSQTETEKFSQIDNENVF